MNAVIILPKGILKVSDKREMREGIQIASQLARKITLVTPGTILGIGTTGTGFSIDTAISLRKNLFDKVPTTPTSIRENILDEYKNKHVRKVLPDLGPMAYILLGGYDDTTKTYRLLENTGKGDSLFDEIKIHNQLKDTVLIGSSLQLRTTVKRILSFS